MIFDQLKIVDPEHQHCPTYKLREFISSYNSKKEQHNEIDLSIEICVCVCVYKRGREIFTYAHHDNI
jgi:hypothetical protein